MLCMHFHGIFHATLCVCCVYIISVYKGKPGLLLLLLHKTSVYTSVFILVHRAHDMERLYKKKYVNPVYICNIHA